MELCHWDPPVARVALLAETSAISERSIVAAAKPFVRPELHARARAGVSSGGGRECGTGRSLRSPARMAGTAGRRSRRRIRCRRAPSDCDTTDRTGAGWSEGASKQTNKQTKRRRTPNADGQTPARRLHSSARAPITSPAHVAQAPVDHRVAYLKAKQTSAQTARGASGRPRATLPTPGPSSRGRYTRGGRVRALLSSAWLTML